MFISMTTLFTPVPAYDADYVHICITGGAGYIGSHTTVEILNAGYRVTILDNFCNSSEHVIERIRELTDRGEDEPRLTVEKADLMDKESIRRVFHNAHMKGTPFSVVIHFASLKSVSESISAPTHYYSNNLTGSLHLLQVMHEFKCGQIIFSSSATVYGTAPCPYREDSPTGIGITNPYGETKAMMEQILRDVYKSAPDRMGVVILRYFNPVGAHPSGRLGENPLSPPTNLMPIVQQVMSGKRDKVTVFGTDYPTADGSAERDYVHVVDLAKGHLAALAWLHKRDGVGCEIFNLGTGKSVSVLKLLEEFGRVVGRPVPRVLGDRRPGDLAVAYCEPNKAEKVLKWKAEKNIEQMCQDTWNWCSKNPTGYD